MMVNKMKILTEHLSSVNESYTQHLVMAGKFACKLLFASVACFIHALIPFIFEKAGSQIVRDLNQNMVEKRKTH